MPMSDMEEQELEAAGKEEEMGFFIYTGKNSSILPIIDITNVRVDPTGIVRQITKGAFTNCTELEVVEFKEGLEGIQGFALSYCLLLEHVKIPSTVRLIGQEAFSYCINLKVVELCKRLEDIGMFAGTAAFATSLSLKHIQIPSTLQMDWRQYN